MIYKATNKSNNKVYIGQTVHTLQRRKSGHLRLSRRPDAHLYFHRAIRKYGEGNFEWEVLDTTEDNSKLNELERYYIECYQSNDSNYGYNMTSGGDSHSEQARAFWSNGDRSDEWRKTLGEKMTDFWSNDENRDCHSQWLHCYYQTDKGKQQAQRHSGFMKDYYNGNDGRMNKAKTAKWFVKATSPSGEVIIFTSSKEPNLYFNRDVHIRQKLKEVGDVWIPGFRANKDIQGWKFEAIKKYKLQ